MNYNGILDTRERETLYKSKAHTRALSPTRKRFEFVGRRDLATLTGSNAGRAIHIIKNGDIHSKYVNLLLTKRNCLSWDSLCQIISDRMKMETAVRKLYTIGGDEVTDPGGFENGGTYVAVGRIRFKQVGYRPAPPLHATTQRILPAISRPSPKKRTSPKKKPPQHQQPTPPPPAPKPPAALPKPAPPSKKKPAPPKIRPQSYMLSVQTMNEPGAGTTAQVTVTLYGSKGTSGAQLLNEDPDNFETGASDTFAIECTPLGKIQRMRLEHDSAGADSSWKVGRVSVRDAVKNETTYFHCNRWLASDRGAFETVIELAAVSDSTPPTANELLIAGATEDDIFSATAAAASDDDAANIVDDSEETAVDVPVDMVGASAVDDPEDDEDIFNVDVDGDVDTDPVETVADDDDDDDSAADGDGVVEDVAAAGDADDEGGEAIEPAPASDGPSAEENLAAAKIQAGYRGHKTRQELNSQGQAATVIQAGFRGHQARKSLNEQQEAATTIQAGFRGHQARKSLKGGQIDESSAEDGAEAEVEAEAESEEAAGKAGPTDSEKEQAVLEIQAAFRGNQARKESESAMQAAKEDLAAAKIQAGFRGHQVRKSIAAETEAATTIQAGFRGHQVRKQLKEKEAAVLEIQAVMRGYQARMAAETIGAFKAAIGVKMSEEDAARIIQSRWRGFVARKQLREKEVAVLELQAAFRGHLARSEAQNIVAEKAAEGAVAAGAADAAAAEGGADTKVDADADDDDDMLEVLEAAAEGHLARTKAKQKIEAIQELQAHARGIVARKKMKKINQQGEHDVTKSGAEDTSGDT